MRFLAMPAGFRSPETHPKMEKRGSVSKAVDLVRRGSLTTANLVRRNSTLTTPQLERLKDHKYNASGSSIFEVFMQPFWRWLVTKVPLWVAPNLLTFAGLLLNILTTVPVAIWDMNMQGEVKCELVWPMARGLP